jgi:hypothetical protein
MTTRTYSSPEAFKQALEQRLRAATKTGGEFARRRQLLVFDRFLARIVAVLGDAATLKGGLVLELRSAPTKLHAYTMPRSRPNSRVKDLPDLALLATVQAIDAKRLRAALDQTFTFRKTHPLPASVPAPPPAWESPYAAMAREDQLSWTSLDDVTKAVQSFLDPVLALGLDAAWDAAAWSWSSP